MEQPKIQNCRECNKSFNVNNMVKAYYTDHIFDITLQKHRTLHNRYNVCNSCYQLFKCIICNDMTNRIICDDCKYYINL
jgi:hypothetical protein